MTKGHAPAWGQYELLRPAEIEAIREQNPIAFLPWGALEWHSYHAPVGLDGLKAHGICLELAANTGGVVLPAVYVGTDTIKPYKGFPHSIEHRFSTVVSLCSEFLEQLADENFKVIVLITGHYGEKHLEAVLKAAEDFRKANPAVKCWAFPDSEPLDGNYPANHAARGETSWQLLFQPELVDLGRLPADRQTTLDEDGVWGEDPRSATAEEGKAMLDLLVSRAAKKISALLEEATS